jgi:hypothetical protein
MADAVGRSDEVESQETGEVDTRFALHELKRDEMSTVQAIANLRNRDIRVAPTHGFNQCGEFCGFRFTLPKDDDASAIPINQHMFHGTSLVQCLSSKQHVHGIDFHGDALELLKNVKECRTTLLKVLHRLRDECVSEASLDCMPVHHEAISSIGAQQQHKMGAIHSTRSRDSSNWDPDLPASVGIYHGFVRRFGHQAREHRVFIVCDGGCKRACDEFNILTLDIAHTGVSAAELCESEEAWWLRKACSRMRAKVVLAVAEAFKLNIPVVADIHAFDDNVKIANCTVETLTHDITCLRNNNIALFNECVDPTTTRNGILLSVNPSEGYLLFKGPAKANSNVADYGSIFGSQSECGIFPVQTRLHTFDHKSDKQNQEVTRREVTHNTSTVIQNVVRDYCDSEMFAHLEETYNADTNNNTAAIAQHTHSSRASKQQIKIAKTYQKIDEEFMRNLERMQWERDNGVVELMPIVVAICS